MSENTGKHSNPEIETGAGTRNFTYNFVVTKDLLDEYNHVNNARYLDLYEQARWDILDMSSFGRDYVKEMGIGPVILEVNVKFKREIGLGEKITITTNSKVEGNRIFLFSQEMLDESGKICSTALFKGALFDLKARKIIRPDEEWLKALGQ